MNFQQLEYVLAVASEGHFGRASEVCNVTQATLSAMIKKLEQELNVVLLDRTKHPVQLTEDGLSFLPIAKRILGARAELSALSSEPVLALDGVLKLGVIPTIAPSLMPLILPVLLMRNPGLKVEVQELVTSEIEHQIASGALDFGIMATPSGRDDLEENVLYYESMMVYGVKKEGLAFVSPADLDAQVWLLERGNCFREQSLTVCNIQKQEGRSEKLSYDGGSFHSLISLTDTLGGYTLVPELWVDQLSAAQQKQVRPFQKPFPVREVSLVSYKPYLKRKTATYLMETIQDIMQGKLSTAAMPNRDLSIIGIN